MHAAIFPADDSAPEAIAAAVDVLASVAPALKLTWPAIDDPVSALEGVSTALFGAASGRSVPLLFHLRWGRQTYANVRPTRWFVGLPSSLAPPEGVDVVIA